jgi:phosphate uptake regulator
MADTLLEDHLVGVELQVVELVEQRERAEVQGRAEEARRLQREIDVLYTEMAETAARLVEAQEPVRISTQLAS